MEYFPAPLEKLVEQFARLPGIGGKSAQRLAFHVLNLPMEEAEDFARAIVEGICEVDDRLTLLALSGSEMLFAAEKAGLRAASEVFADRAYQANGTLVPRSQPGAMITDENEAIARVVRMVTEGVVTSIDGIDVPLRADSICVHGDGEKALLFVQKIRAALEEKGVALKAL